MAGVVAWLVISALTILWSLSVPLMSAPDEPHHVVKAVAVWRGEWLGVHAKGFNVATMTVQVPQTYERALGEFDCYRQRSAKPAGCAKPIIASSKIVPARTHVGRYPPFYYLLVGWPSLLSVAADTMRWMRVISALLNSAVLGFGVFLIRRFRMGAGVLVGLCCTLTPVSIYMDSTVQPNGLEVSLGILVAICVIGLARFADQTPDLELRPPRLLIATTGAAASALVLVRGLSPLWLGCLGIVALLLVPWAHWRRWLGLRDVRIWIGVVVVFTALALAWIIGSDALAIQPWASAINPYQHVSDFREFQLVLGRDGWYAEQMIGKLTRDSQLPIPAYIVAFTALCLMIIVGFVRGTIRERIALGFSFLGSALIPVALAAPRIRTHGINWQGRYIMPFAAAIVLIAAMAAFRPVRDRGRTVLIARIAALMVVATFLLEGVSYWSTVRRYTVGTNGPLNLLSVAHPDWSPVLPLQLLAAVVPVLLGGIAVFFVALLPRCEAGP